MRKEDAQPLELKVSDLRSHNGLGWDNELLESLFNTEEVSLIKEIPVSVVGIKDRLVWRHSKDGQYNVKSGYQLASERAAYSRNKAESTSKEQDDQKLWKRIWGLEVKKKVQHFLWRSCNDSLPVNLNMLRRGIHIDAICNQCGMEPESVEHVMFKCAKAQLIWKLAPIRWDGILEYQNTFKEWWRSKGDIKLRNRIQERLEISAYLFWHL